MAIGVAVLAFIAVSSGGWLLGGEITLLLSGALALAGLLTIQLELYRRLQAEQWRKRPAEQIPSHLLDAYTLGGRIPVESWYCDDVPALANPRVYDSKQINLLMKQAQERATGVYGETDRWLYEALEKHPVRSREVMIFGSTTPWYESMCLHHGGKCTTVDYNRILSKDPRLSTMTVEEYGRKRVRFDAALSISSFEHDGLGRYGDPLHPRGDLEAMEKLKEALRPGGILFLSVPVGKDTLVWNAHRVYGKIRLPMLLAGWRTLDTFGFDESLTDQDTDRGRRYVQPVFVLQPSPEGAPPPSPCA